MKRLVSVVRREYLERVRSKPFIISTVVGPLVMVGLMVGPSLMLDKNRDRALRVAVVDGEGLLGPDLEKRLREHEVDERPLFELRSLGSGPIEARRERARADVLGQQLDGYVYVPPGGYERHEAEYYGRNVSNLRELRELGRVIDAAALARRLGQAGVAPERVGEFTRRFDLKTVRLSRSGEREDRGDSFLFSVLLMMLLYAATAMWGSALMNGVIEEKTNRVVEVVVSSIPTSTLFGGKLLGVGAAGLTQFAVWAGVTALAGSAGVQGALMGGVGLPEVPWHVPLLLVVFFVLGFFLYGALFAAVGAAVNSQQEAQSLVFIAMLPLIVGTTFFPVVASRPDGTLATVLSLVPFWTPLLMFLRVVLLTPPVWQVALGIVLTLATVVLFNWGAARIYRVGILMYGKRPTLPEILRWIGRS
jgi:ABC-2 type transport system permease protein